MEVQILNVISKYIKAGKQVDKTFIEEIAEIIIHYKSLNEYVNKIEVSNKKNTIANAEYDINEKNMVFYLFEMQQNLNMFNKNNQLKLDKYESKIFNYQFFIRTILHEMEHANQEKKLNEYKDDLETQLINWSFEPHKTLEKNFLKNMKMHILYIKYYIYNPTERLANIHAYRILKNMFKEEQSHVPNLFKYISNQEIKMLLLGYNERYINKDIDNFYTCIGGNYIYKQLIEIIDSFYSILPNFTYKSIIISPTPFWLNCMNLKHEWQTLNFYCSNDKQLIKNAQINYSLDERLLLGLPISHNEYHEKRMLLK